MPSEFSAIIFILIIILETKFNTKENLNLKKKHLIIFISTLPFFLYNYYNKFNFYYFTLNYYNIYQQLHNNSFRSIYYHLYYIQNMYIIVLAMFIVTLTYLIVFFYKEYCNKNINNLIDFNKLKKMLYFSKDKYEHDEYDSILDLIEDPLMYKIHM